MGSQVTGGDYASNASFKGYATPATTPVGVCEPAAHTSGSPLLDQSCWTSKPGNSQPPSTLSAYIGVIVSTSIAKQGSTIYGNIAATVVLQVDPTSRLFRQRRRRSPGRRRARRGRAGRRCRSPESCGGCKGPDKEFRAANVKTRLAVFPWQLENQKKKYSLDYDCKDCKKSN